MAIDEAREDRARRLAAAQGLQLVKSPTRNPDDDNDDDNYELYVLTRDAAEVGDAFKDGYGMTLLDIEKALHA